MNVLVFERGAGKYVRIDTRGEVIYTSDRTYATMFNLIELRSAKEFFEDFEIYKRTMLAVPVGTNKDPTECDTVNDFIAKTKEANHEA